MFCSRIGAIAERIFATECLKRDIDILKPIVDDKSVDFVIKIDNKYKSVQVKSTQKKDKYSNKYKIGIKKGAVNKSYDPNDFDILVCYIFEIDSFYIIPYKFISHTSCIKLNPDNLKCKYSEFKESWHYLT